MEEVYKVLYPMRVCLITSRHEGKDNVMTAAWVMPVSWDPLLFAVAVGKERHSWGMIKGGKAFGLNLPHGELSEAALLCGTESGRDIDKFERSGLELERQGKVPLLKDCPVSIECELVDSFDTGDHTLFIGKPVRTIKRFDAKGLYQSRKEEFIEL